jgi:20S proteasome subunit beta 2
MGSGSLAAMAVLESRYRPDMGRAAAVALASDAVEAGIWNDLGSGSNVDVVVLSHTEGAIVLRNHRVLNAKPPRTQAYTFPSGTAVILRETVKQLAPPSMLID